MKVLALSGKVAGMKPKTSPFERAAREHIASRRSPGTREGYEYELESWLAFCRARKADPSAPSLTVATTYREELEHKRKLKPQTVRRALSALSSMYTHAINSDPRKPKAKWNLFNARTLPRPSPHDVTLTPLVTEEDSRKLLDYLASDDSPLGLRDLATTLLLYSTGLRSSSVAGLKLRDLTFRDGKQRARVKLKGGKAAEVEIPADAAKALRHWLDFAREGLVSMRTGLEPPTDHVFVTKSGRPLSPQALSQNLKQRAKVIGLTVNPHRFRAAFITTALSSGASLHEVQAAVHHADPKTTVRYDRAQRGEGVSAAVQAFRSTGQRRK